MLHSFSVDVKCCCFFTFACVVNRTKKVVLVGHHRPIKSPYGISSSIGPNVCYFIMTLLKKILSFLGILRNWLPMLLT